MLRAKPRGCSAALVGKVSRQGWCYSAVCPDELLLVGAARALGDSSECLSGPQRGQAVLRLPHGCLAAMAHNRVP